MDDDRRRWTLWITKDSLWWWSLLHGSPWPLGPSKRLDVLRTFFFGVENHAHKNGRFCCTASQRHNTNGRILKRLWFFCLKNRCLQTEELSIPRFASRHLPSLTALKQLSTYIDVCVFLRQIFWESCILMAFHTVGSKSQKNRLDESFHPNMGHQGVTWSMDGTPLMALRWPQEHSSLWHMTRQVRVMVGCLRCGAETSSMSWKLFGGDIYKQIPIRSTKKPHIFGMFLTMP